MLRGSTQVPRPMSEPPQGTCARLDGGLGSKYLGRWLSARKRLRFWESTNQTFPFMGSADWFMEGRLLQPTAIPSFINQKM